VIRYGDRRQLKVELMEAPAEEPARRVAEAPRAEPDPERSGTRLGVAVAPLNATLARQYGLEEGPGIVITRVEPYGPAGRQGIPEGTRVIAVDGQVVREVADFRRTLERKRPGEVVSLQVRFPRGGQQSIVNIRLPG
jgi:serine protease Do